MPRRSGDRRGGARRGQDQQDDQQGSDEQQQPVPQLESFLVFPLGIHEIPTRRKDHHRRLATLNQMEKDLNTGGQQPSEDPRVEKRDHAIPAG
jgi:hypothetical protein